jgi:serine/threonine-protein phosphatase 4 catalytic subunit
MNAMV